MKKLQALLIAGVATGVLMAASAQANVIIDYEGQTIDDLSATVVLDFADVAVAPPDVILTATATNTSDIASTLMRIAFDLPGGLITTLEFNEENGWAVYGASGGSPIAGLDVCIGSPPPGPPGGGGPPGGVASTCEGGPPEGGILQGQTLVFTFNITTDSSAVALHDATADGYANGSLNSVVKFQQVGPGGELSDFADGTPGNGTPIPEPATLALLGIGLLGAGYMARRRRDDA